jgi:hypothetical protein
MQPVSRGTRDSINYRQALPGKAVKKRAFANVGAPDQGDDGFCHLA